MSLDYIWIIISACFVFFMQAGFICYEVGFVQAKNVVSVAIENILAFVIATLIFCLWGYGLMFGPTLHGLWGNSLFLLNGLSRADNLPLFIQFFFNSCSLAPPLLFFRAVCLKEPSSAPWSSHPSVRRVLFTHFSGTGFGADII